MTSGKLTLVDVYLTSRTGVCSLLIVFNFIESVYISFVTYSKQFILSFSVYFCKEEAYFIMFCLNANMTFSIDYIICLYSHLTSNRLDLGTSNTICNSIHLPKILKQVFNYSESLCSNFSRRRLLSLNNFILRNPLKKDLCNT